MKNEMNELKGLKFFKSLERKIENYVLAKKDLTSCTYMKSLSDLEFFHQLYIVDEGCKVECYIPQVELIICYEEDCNSKNRIEANNQIYKYLKDNDDLTIIRVNAQDEDYWLEYITLLVDECFLVSIDEDEDIDEDDLESYEYCEYCHDDDDDDDDDEQEDLDSVLKDMGLK